MRTSSVSLILIIAVLAPLPGCNRFQLPLDSEWKPTAGFQVLRLRWVKPLSPTMPNFLIPELQEEHDRFNPIETSSAAFDTDKKRAFVGSSTGGLYCLDIRLGRTIWRFDIQDPVGSAPVYDAARKSVYFGADDGRFYAVHARSGRKLWTVDTGAEIRKKAILHNDTLYLVNADNTVFAMAPDKGEIIWQYRRLPVEGFTSAGHAGLTLANGKLITGFNDGYLVALDPLVGAEIWTSDLASEVSRVSGDGVVKLVDSDATPTVVGDVLVSASVDGGVRGLDVETGKVMWTNPSVTGVTGLAASNGTVYAARSSVGLTALEPQSGEVIWTKRFMAGTLLDPLVYKDILVISDSEFGLYLVSAIDGKLLQKLDQGEGFLARPSMHAGYLLVLGNNGTLYAMSVL